MENESNRMEGNNANTVLPAVFLFGIKVVRYRIVKDDCAGYECQKWRIWFPFWFQIGMNTHCTIDHAIGFIVKNKTVVMSS